MREPFPATDEDAAEEDANPTAATGGSDASGAAAEDDDAPAACSGAVMQTCASSALRIRGAFAMLPLACERTAVSDQCGRTLGQRLAVYLVCEQVPVGAVAAVIHTRIARIASKMLHPPGRMPAVRTPAQSKA